MYLIQSSLDYIEPMAHIPLSKKGMKKEKNKKEKYVLSVGYLVEILKNKNKKNTKMLSFFKQQSYFSQIVSKKAKITI